jgi:uncharacterized RmlC-like cupin family protein
MATGGKGEGMGEADPVVRITEEDRRPGAPTPGMHREEAVSTETTWGGFLRTDAGVVSGWHHHGEYESVIYVLSGAIRMESGPDGGSVVDAGPGDFLFVPRGSIHRESNPVEEELTAVVVRSGRGEAVVNVEGPASRGA